MLGRLASAAPTTALRTKTGRGARAGRATITTIDPEERWLTAGLPVNLAAWAQARKRLYDTGVFRQVDIQAVPVGAAPLGTPPPIEQPTQARVTLDEWPPLLVRYGFELDDTVVPASENRSLRPGVAADATALEIDSPPDLSRRK